MRRGSLITIVAALLYCIFLLGCGTGNLPRARVVNASPDSPNLDVFAGGIVVGSNLPFRAASSYRRIDDGFDDVLFFAAGTDDLLLQGTPFFAQRQEYTIVALDFLQFLNAIVLTDDNSAPSGSNFKLRFVHASPTAAAVDVYITVPTADLAPATASFSNVAFQGFAGYANQPQGTFQLRVTSAGSKDVIADSGTLTFMAGQIRTAVLVNPPGNATEPLGIVLVRDAF
jgi:hypothetical protein